jgi:hypothetical protein
MDGLSWNGAIGRRILSRGAIVFRAEIAMNKPGLHKTGFNKSSRAALAAAAVMVGISAASVGSAAAADGANAPAAKMQNDKTKIDKRQNANASTQRNDELSLSDAQRKTAWQDLYMDSLNQNTPPGFDVVVGATVPNTIVIAPVTAQAGSDVPALKPYSFAMVQKKLLIVNPSSRKIAEVIAR